MTYTSGVTVKNGGVINTSATTTLGDGVSAIANFTVTGAGSLYNGSTGVLLTSDTVPATANINITAGGKATFAQVEFGAISAIGAGANFTGTSLTVSGTNSLFSLVGVPATTPGGTDAFGANLFVSNAGGQKSNIVVNNGGTLDLLSTSTDPNQNGAMIVSQAPNTTASLTVDGPTSVISAGTFLQIQQRSSTGTAIANAQTTLNITNGGTFKVVDDGAPFSGNAQIGLNFNASAPSSTSLITINIGGGTGASDANSVFSAAGGMFLGNAGDVGSDTTNGGPVPGVAINVNVNNGSIEAGTIDVGPSTIVNLNKGVMNAGLIAVSGGAVKLSPTAAPGVGVLLADAYDVGAEGYIDIGKSGGVSVVNPGDTTDLSKIKSLIVAGLSGGNNSIKSSALTVDSGDRLRLASAQRCADVVPRHHVRSDRQCSIVPRYFEGRRRPLRQRRILGPCGPGPELQRHRQRVVPRRFRLRWRRRLLGPCLACPAL